LLPTQTAIALAGLAGTLLISVRIDKKCRLQRLAVCRCIREENAVILPFKGKEPKIAPSAYIAPTAVVIGDVEIMENASIWFNTVVRGDEEKIIIGAGTNIQDNCTLHSDPDVPLIIGERVTVGHNAVVHGCTIEDCVLIGMHATVLNRAVVAKGSIVAAGALVKEGQLIGPCQLAVGMPAQIKRDTGDTPAPEIEISAAAYLKLAAQYRQIS
jgi:carbonic anhydrase/acetyltransferase-like protein (isoleucine patch superfamily)